MSDKSGIPVTAFCDFDAPKPIPMRLICEGCGKLHIDEGEFATKPHHTHSCQFCGLTWRPAVVPTVGVRFLPGFKNVIEAKCEDPYCPKCVPTSPYYTRST
jgi:hypothetical protein